MTPSTTSLVLNLQYPNIATVAYAVQGDEGAREISAQLVDGSIAWEPPSGALATVRYRKPDGTTGFYDTLEDGSTPAVVMSGNTATIGIARQALTVPGGVVMQLNFYDTDAQRVTTFSWIMIVQPSVLTDTQFVSSDYYNILSQQIAAVLDAAAALTGMTAIAFGLPTGSDPTVDVTGGTGGTPYNLAFGIPAGPVGPTGPQGVSITETVKKSGTGAPGTTDVYGVELSNGTEAGTFNVYNGVDGQGSPGTAVPLSGSIAGAVGSSDSFSREDHRHPLPMASDIVMASGDTVQADVAELLTFEALHITGSISSNQMYLTDSRITADMRVIECTIGTPANVATDLAWTTAAGQITFSGTLTAATSIDLILGKTN